jgi:hypothetical protein
VSLQTEQAADLADIFYELGETFTFGASSIPCSVTFRGQGRKNDLGGFLDDFDVTITARIADLPGTPPAVGNTVTHRSRSYRIERVESGQTNVEIRYLCTAVNR